MDTSTRLPRPSLKALSARRWLWIAFASAIACVSTAYPANAQDPARPLTVAEAVRIAERRSPVYRQVLNDPDVASAGVREASAAYLPRLFAGLNFGGNSARRVTATDPFGNAVRLDDPITFRSSSAAQSIGLDYTFFDGGARERRLSAARFDLRAAEARADAARVLLRGEVARRYYQALGAGRQIALEEQLLASAREQLAATERLFGVAGASRVDVLGGQADVATREGALDRARGEASKRMLELREALGVEDDVAFVLADSLPTVSELAGVNADSLVALALRASPRLAALDAVAEAQGRLARAARGARWPALSANASFGRYLSDRNYDALFDLNPRDQSLSFGFNASIPIFDRFQTSGSVARADAATADAREELRAGRLGIAREVRSAAIDLENTNRRIQLAERAAALSRERVELAREQYRAGAIRFPELQQVLDRDASSSRDVIDARVALAVARAPLEEKVGSSTAP
ncbi:MAG: TolC family protein [Gemmatimonadota bacterium]|nr:TolC family protein [Gemmatimonadota bacterium]